MQEFLKFPEELQSSGSLAVRLLAPMFEPGRYQVEGSRGSQQILGVFFSEFLCLKNMKLYLVCA